MTCVATWAGLAPEKPTVLVVGGGDGVGGLRKIAEAVGDQLGKRAEEMQLVVVCGKNKVVQKALEERAWAANLVRSSVFLCVRIAELQRRLVCDACWIGLGALSQRRV